MHKYTAQTQMMILNDDFFTLLLSCFLSDVLFLLLVLLFD